MSAETRTTVSGGAVRPGAREGAAYARWLFRAALGVLLLALFPAISLCANSQTANRRKHVLVIYSAENLFSGEAGFDEGIRSALRANEPGGTRFYSEFWDENRAGDPSSEKKWLEYLRWKYADRKIDVVVAVATPAFEFMLNKGMEAFPKVPLVFCLFGNDKRKIPGFGPGVFGFLAPVDWEATLRTIFQLQPSVRHIVVVCGTSAVDKELEGDARTVFQPYEGRLRFRYLTDVTMSGLLAKLSRLPPDSAIFWIAFSRDASGETFPPTEAMQIAAGVANAPLYGSIATDLGRGIVGGRLFDFRRAGEDAGRAVAGILSGVGAPPVTNVETASFYGFDWRALKRWHLDEERLPAGSMVEYRQQGIWQRYKWEIVGVVGIALLEGLLIAWLLVERSHRKRTAKALRSSESLKASVLASLRNHVAVLDRTGHIIAVNPAWEEFGRSNGAGDPSKVGVGVNYLEVCRRASDQQSPKAAEALAGIQAVLDGSRPFLEMEYPCDSPSERRWFLMTVTPLQVPEGGAVVKHADVTALRRAQAAQREAESLVSEIVSAVRSIVWRRDAGSDCFSFVSRQAETILGFPALQWTSRPNFWIEHLHPDDRERTLAFFHRAVKKGQPFECEYRMIAADGRVVWMRDIVNVVFAEDQAKELTGVTIDITEHKEGLSRLHESEERFRRLADTAPVLIWMSGPDKGCTYCNQPWLDFTGKPLKEQLGEGWAKSVHPEDASECWTTYSTAFDARRGFRMEYRIRRADGEYRWVLDTGVPRFGPEGTFLGYVGSCIDISDLKQGEEELLGLSGRLIRVQEEERSNIARELHDDVSQRLALLSIGLEQLCVDPPNSPDSLKQGLTRSLEQLSDVAADIHQLSYRLHPSKLDHLGLVAAVAAFCRELARQKKIQVDFADRDVPRTVPAEIALCLYRVTQEALQNVVKHSGAERARVELMQVPGGLLLMVSDSGNGFDPDSAKAAPGLGMVSMRERLRLVGGHLAISSEPGTGTRVEAWVPLEASAGSGEDDGRYEQGTAA